MSVIYYGMCGEGLGHCARAVSLMEHLPDHEFHIFTYGDGYDYLLSLGYNNLHRIHGLGFEISNGKVNAFGTFKKLWEFYRKYYALNKDRITTKMMYDQPDLILTDWEPTLPRMAQRFKVPCISVDSQHKFRFSSLPGFPWHLKLYGAMASIFSRFMVPHVDRYVLSTYQTDLIERQKGVTLAQCFIRKQLADLESTDEGHLLVYVRQKEIARKMLLAMSKVTDRKIICYGVSLSEEFPNVDFKPRSYTNFAKDLASCHAIFSTAGIQLIGEARYYGKPSFVVPLPGQHEQSVNGVYVDLLRLGMNCNYNKLTSNQIKTFLHIFNCGLPPSENGVHKAVQLIEQFLD